MRIYRFTPRIGGHAHPVRSVVGRWWPEGIELASWMTYLYDASSFGIHPHAGNRYRRSPEEMAPSDFPVLSLQVPVVSERAAERLGFHPERGAGGSLADLVDRLRPIWIEDERFFAVQPLLGARDQPHAFIPEASAGIRLPRGEIVHYHTRAFEPSRLRGEFFTLPAHEPFGEVYVTEGVVDPAREAGLTGLEDLELVFDNEAIPPHHTPLPPETLERPSYRRELEWELFEGRGSMWHYSPDDLKEAFRRAVLDGLLSVG